MKVVVAIHEGCRRKTAAVSEGWKGLILSPWKKKTQDFSWGKLREETIVKGFKMKSILLKWNGVLQGSLSEEEIKNSKYFKCKMPYIFYFRD